MTINTGAAKSFNLGDGNVVPLPTGLPDEDSQLQISAEGVITFVAGGGVASSGATNVIQLSDGDGGFSASGLETANVSGNEILRLPGTSSGVRIMDGTMEFLTNAGAIHTQFNNFGLRIDDSATLMWKDINGSNTVYCVLTPDGQNQLALRNGANAQSFSVYSTYTDASNYERLSIAAQTGDGYRIATEWSGTGQERDIEFWTNILRFRSVNGDSPQLVWQRDDGNTQGKMAWSESRSHYLFGSGSNVFILARTTDTSTNFGHGSQTDPTLFVHSAAGSQTQYYGVTHDQTDVLHYAGSGAHKFLAHASGDADPSNLSEVMSVDATNGLIAGGLQMLSGKIGPSAWPLSGVEPGGGATNVYQLSGNIIAHFSESRLGMQADTALRWTNHLTDASSGTTRVELYADDVGQLAQRDGANAQSFSVYSTYTDASNYSRLRFVTDAAGPIQILSEYAGTGVNQPLIMDGNNRSVYARNHFKVISVNMPEIGFVGGDPSSGSDKAVLTGMIANFMHDQLCFPVPDNVDRSFIVCETRGQAGDDFDHGLQTNPTVFVQSATEPDTDNTQYYGVTHDQTDVLHYAGSGAHKFLAHASGDADPSNLSEVMSADTTAITLKSDPIIESPTVPSSASDTGTAGQVAWDASYIYVCTATDTWKRAAIASW